MTVAVLKGAEYLPAAKSWFMDFPTGWVGWINSIWSGTGRTVVWPSPTKR